MGKTARRSRPPPPTPAPRGHGRELLMIAGALVAYAALAWGAVLTKSPTYDEPLSAVSAWAGLRWGDYRMDYEHPPLWKYWAALPHGAGALVADPGDPSWQALYREPGAKWSLSAATLYSVRGNDPFRIIEWSRAMMLLPAVGLGALLAGWAWRVFGPTAAVVAAVGFALDPTFLGHGPLVKNDVAMALVFVAAAHALWMVGRRADPLRVGWLAVVVGAALTVKMSALLIPPIVCLVLLIRALLPEAWPVSVGVWGLPHARGMGGRLAPHARRLLLVVGIIVFVAIVSYVLIWAVYRFRYAPTADPAGRIDLAELVRLTAQRDLTAELGRAPTAAELGAWRPDAMTRANLWMDRHRVLPQAFVAGLQFTRQTAAGSWAYLLGRVRFTGWWCYFPLAMLFKTPVATLLGLSAAAGIGTALAVRRRAGRDVMRRWDLLCLLIPPAIYFASGLASRVNLGIRYMLPVYPFLYVFGGGVAAWAWRNRPRAGRPVLAALGLVLVIESAVAFPNYIAFFNAPSGGSRGGLRLLGDSNLDWGQDLPALDAWQRRHPGVTLYLAYSGMADPDAHGIRYVNVGIESPARSGRLRGAYPFGLPARQVDLRSASISPDGAGVLAVSATYLQGIPLQPGDPFAVLRGREPMEVLEGTIYLYPLPLPLPP